MAPAYVPPHRRKRESSIRIAATEAKQTTCALTEAIDIVECINLNWRVDKWRHFHKEVESTGNPAFLSKIKRFSGIDGASALESGALDDVCIEWDASINAKYSSKAVAGRRTMTPGEIGCALSHVALWRKLVVASSGRAEETSTCMMILEDDAVFTKKHGKSRFVEAFDSAWSKLPVDFGVLFLGFSSRGERSYISENDNVKAVKTAEMKTDTERPIQTHHVKLYIPEYGYHTHAYVITDAAARHFLEHVPVQGPIDVWLADNHYFDIPVYCAVIANEGWQSENGTFEGSVLVSQDRSRGSISDVVQSSNAASVPK